MKIPNIRKVAEETSRKLQAVAIKGEVKVAAVNAEAQIKSLLKVANRTETNNMKKKVQFYEGP